jgi:hypothetical protein
MTAELQVGMISVCGPSGLRTSTPSQDRITHCAQFCAYQQPLPLTTDCCTTARKPAPDKHLQQFIAIHRSPSKLLICRSTSPPEQ